MTTWYTSLKLGSIELDPYTFLRKSLWIRSQSLPWFTHIKRFITCLSISYWDKNPAPCQFFDDEQTQVFSNSPRCMSRCPLYLSGKLAFGGRIYVCLCVLCEAIIVIIDISTNIIVRIWFTIILRGGPLARNIVYIYTNLLCSYLAKPDT